MRTKFARRAEKNDNRLFFDESRFLGSVSLDLGSSIYFSIISMFSVTRRADGHIPTRRVIRCSGNLQNAGLQHSDEAKDLEWRLN